MSGRERRKGREGEREARKLLESFGFEVRGLEGSGDHLALADGLVLHVEVKRTEKPRPYAYMEQATAEAPAGTVPVVLLRRSGSRWLLLGDAERLLGELLDGR